MNDPVKLSIVVPTYNEESNIANLLKLTHVVLEDAKISHELIVVDDGSRDQTIPQIKELMQNIPQIVLIQRTTERGLASAMVRGYNDAKGHYVGAMDADLAHDPKHLPEMIALLDNGQADFTIGSRYVKGARFEGKPLINKITSLAGQFLVKIFLNMEVKDTSNNYRVFSKKLWEQIKTKVHPDGNVMLTEIVYLAQKNGARIIEIPIIYKERRVGKSKLNIIKETSRFFKNIFKIRNGN